MFRVFLLFQSVNIIFPFILYYIHTYIHTYIRTYISTVVYFTTMALNLAESSAKPLWTVHAFTDIRMYIQSGHVCV